MLQERLDDDDVRDVLQAIPRPVADIRPGWITPKIGGGEVNRAFVTWLQTRGFIASWKQGGLFDDAYASTCSGRSAQKGPGSSSQHRFVVRSGLNNP